MLFVVLVPTNVNIPDELAGIAGTSIDIRCNYTSSFPLADKIIFFEDYGNKTQLPVRHDFLPLLCRLC